MDNFMDKLAQKLNAQEVIKANSQAEAAEMEKLQLQVAEYEKILQEMRKLNYKNAELSEKLEEQVGENALRMKELQSDELKLISVLRDLTQEQIRNREALVSQMEIEKQEDSKQDMKAMEEFFKRSDDFVHKENVKVYRNVQAVVIDELKKQTQDLETENEKLHSRMNIVMIFSVITMLVSVISVIVQIISGLNIKFF